MDYLQKVHDKASFHNESIFFGNVEDRKDYHLDIHNSLTSKLSKLFAVRISLQFLYNNFPALTPLALFDADADAGGEEIGTVLTRKKKLDTIFKVTFVITLS